MFGNRLGNCAYDKSFLRDVKTQTNGTRLLINTNLRPANYPKPTVEIAKENLVVPSAVQVAISHNQNHNHNHNHNNNHNHNVYKVEFDESIFDNSMMISEEDLICSEDGLIIGREQQENVYPILPFKRK